MMEQEDIDQPKKSFLKRFWWVGLIIVAIAFMVIITFKPFGKGDQSDKNTDNSDPTKKAFDVEKQSENKTIQDESKEVGKSDGLDIDPDNPPQFIQADFVELDKVYMISKFRSGVGHDFSINSGETCRSMKHYFSSMDASQPDYKQEGGGDKEKMPLPTIDKDVKIFSPVDGTLKFVDFDQTAFNHELQVEADAYPGMVIRLMHVQNAPNIKEGHVKAGELIGLVLANQSFDLAIEFERKSDNGEKLRGYVSYFAAMPDNILAKYLARGAKSRDDFIITKAYRDAHPFSCHGKEVFDENYGADDIPGNEVLLSGFKELESQLNAKYRK